MESPIAQTESPLEILRRLENLVRVGTIAEVRHGRPARCRVRTGNLTTTWVPWLSARAGGRKRRQWWPPVVGEQCLLLAPGGDLLNAVAIAGIFSDAAPQGAEGANVCRTDLSETEAVEHNADNGMLVAVIERGISLRIIEGATLDMTRDRITLRAGGGSLVIDANGVRGEPDVRSGSISLRTHRHGGVERGPDNTGAPL